MRTDSEIFIARAEHSTASAAVLDLHACAGVAAAAVPAPAARSGVAGAATPGSWGPRPHRDGWDRSVRGLRACVGMSRWLQAPVPPLARRMSPRRFPRFRVYSETGRDQTDPQSNGHHRKFVRSNGLRLNGRRGTMVSPLLEAGFLYRDSGRSIQSNAQN